MIFSDTVGPDELFGNGIFRESAKVFQERTLLEVDIHAVSKAVMFLADEGVLVHAEGEFWVAAAELEALERGQSNLLGEAERAE